MSTYNIYVTGDSSHPAGFPMDKNVASHIPTNCDLLVYVGDVYPQGVRYCYEVGTNITSATRTAGFDFAFGERSGHNLVPKMCMLPGNHEYEDAPEGPNAAGVYPVPLTAVGGAHSGDLATLASVGHDYYWTRAANTYALKADGTVGSGADYKSVNSNVYPSGSMTPINNTTFNGGSTPAVYNGVTQGRHDCYFDIGGVRFVVIDDSQYTGSITAGAGGGGGDEAFMPLSNGTAAQQARWNKLTGWVDGATGNACIVFAHRTRYPCGNANGNHKPSALLGPFHAYCTGRIIAWVNGHWHNAARTVPIKAGSNPTSLTAAANTCAFSGSGTTASPRVITNNDGFPIFCQGNGGNSLNGFTQQYASLGQVPDAMREYGDAANYGYMHIHYDTNSQITFDQYNCGSSAAGAATTNTLAAGITYKTTATVTPPTTPNPPVLVTTPGDPDTDTTPTFAWTAADAITASYQYKVDGAAWPGTGTTLTTVTLGALSASASPGTSHTFYVRAVAADGTTVSSQTSYTWHVTTTTTSAPTSFACSLGATGATTTSSTASFSWASGGADDVSYQYSLDGGAWTSNGASLTKTFSTIGVGSHTFQVRALNSTSVPSSAVPGTAYAWTVNTNPPPTGQVLFGQSHAVGSPVGFDRTTLTNAEGALSRQIYLAHTLYNWGDNPPTVSTSDEKWMLDRGSFPVINCLGRLNPASVGQDFPRTGAPVSSGVMFGSYVDTGGGGESQAEITARETALGRSYAIDGHFYGSNVPADGFPEWDLTNGRTPLITTSFGWGNGTFPGYTSVTGGSQDTILNNWATYLNGLQSHGTVLLRIFQEFNGTWFNYGSSTSGYAAGFANMWRYIYNRWNAAGVDLGGRVQLIWCPNAEANYSISSGTTDNGYPGDAYVDWIGVDLYDKDSGGTGAGLTFANGLGVGNGGVYDRYASTGKPFIAPEFGCVDHVLNQRRDWFNAMKTLVTGGSVPLLRGLVYWDAAGNNPDTAITLLGGGHPSFEYRTDHSAIVASSNGQPAVVENTTSNTNSFNAWKAVGADSNFQATITPGTTTGFNDAGLTDIANGVYDAHIKAWAQFSKDLGGDHFTRIWREMTNGAGACVWRTSTGPIFVAAWKRLYTIYKATSYTDYNTNVNPSHPISGSPINASNAIMVWCPAVWGSVWDTWYPGDAYVDWVATDGYSYDTTATAANSNGPQGGWHSFHDIFVNWYTQFNPTNGTKAKKPLMIAEVNAETSTSTAHNRAAFWSGAEASLKQDFPLVSAAVTWVDGQFPDFGVTGSSEYVAYANDAVMSATTIAGTGGGGGSVVTLTVTNPPADITVTDTDAYTLAGTASGGAGLALTINGSSVALTTGSDQSFTDTFGRTTSGGMGGTWTASGNTSVQSTNGSAGLFTALPANGTSRNVAGAVIADADIYMSESLSTLPVTGAYQHHTLFRWISANQGYHLVTWQDATAGSPVKMVINRVVGGVTTGIPSSSTTAVAASVATAGTVVWRRVKYVGNHIQAKVWTGLKSAEPGGLGSDTNWTVDVTDTDPSAITASGDVGFSVFRAAAETANPTATVDNWALTDLSAASGGGSSTFSSAVTLSRGANVYNFVATDTSGASATTIRTITYTPASTSGSLLPADTDTGTLYQTLDCQIYTVANSQAVSAADWQAVADTYAIVVENPPGARLYPYADDIQTRTPTIWLGTYNKGTGIRTSVTGLPEAWYAHSVARSNATWGATTRVHLSGSTAHWMAQPDGTGNWTDTSGTVGAAGHVYGSWKEYHAAEVANDLAAVNARYPAGVDPYGALFLDSLGVGNFNGQVDPATGTAYSSTPLVWYGLINQAVTYISTVDAGDLVETNGADTNTGLAAVSDVAMIEGFMFNGAFNTPTTRLTPSAFAAICNKAIATQAAGAYVSLLDKTWDSATATGWANATNAQLRDAAQLIRGAYHLVNQGKCLIEWSTQASNAGIAKPWVANRTAYWGLDLSAPRDTQTSLSGYVVATNVGTNGGSVYRRRFLRGVVYVNTGNQPIAVQLDRADYHEFGISTLLTSPYTVPAQGAAILLADQDPTGGVIRVSTTPAVNGTAQAGATLTTTAGSWSDGTQIITPTSIAYAWQSALDDGLGGVLLPWTTISGATSTTYIAQNGDVGSHIRSSVTAFDSGGNRATAASQPTAIIIAAPTPPPTVTAAPVITPGGASPQVGDVLTSTAGTFSGATSQTIRWQRGDTTSGAWADITSATATTYTVQSADSGFALRTVATAANSGGSISTTSQPTLVVTGVIAAPQNITPPTITGNPVVGETLVGDAGQWTGDNLTFTYQWQRQ